MQIRTKGKPSKIPMNECKEACKFFAEYLLGKRLAANIDLTLEFEQPDHDFDLGFCSWDDDNDKPRFFTITINRNLSKKQTILTLAHEMVHLSQYAKGHLKDYVRGAARCKWHGKPYNVEEMCYWSLPWEREARGMEAELFVYFRDIRRGNKSK